MAIYAIDPERWAAPEGETVLDMGLVRPCRLKDAKGEFQGEPEEGSEVLGVVYFDTESGLIVELMNYLTWKLDGFKLVGGKERDEMDKVFRIRQLSAPLTIVELPGERAGVPIKPEIWKKYMTPSSTSTTVESQPP